MKPTGGPAFPLVDAHLQQGMTLRDYFAGEALAECIRVAADQTPGPDPLLTALFDKAAAYAYYAADAMLAARDKP